MSPLGAVKGDEQGQKKYSVSRSDTLYIYRFSDVLSDHHLQLSKRAATLQNLCRYSSRLHTRARGKGRESAELLTSSANSRGHGVGRARQTSSIGRFLFFFKGRFWPIAALSHIVSDKAPST